MNKISDQWKAFLIVLALGSLATVAVASESHPGQSGGSGACSGPSFDADACADSYGDGPDVAP